MGDKVYTELDVKGLKNLLEVVDNGNANDCKAIILKFGASWCGPCKRIKPLCDFWLTELPKNIIYFDIDIDNNVDLYVALKAKKMINGVPTILSYVKRPDRDMSLWYASDLSVIGDNTNNINSFFTCIKKYELK
jgi:thiol-disulfide isomerase/thioredoxin